MTRRRWIADEFSSTTAALTGQNAAHLARVLRTRVGQEFEVACGDQVYDAVVSSVAPGRVEFSLNREVEAAQSSGAILLLSVFKFDRFEWAVEKVTELGIAQIVPVIVRRTDAHLAAASEKRVERWRKIAKEAAQQSRRNCEPAIQMPQKLKPALEEFQAAQTRIVLAENERNRSLTSALAKADSGSPVVLAIGPEGGWTEEELNLFQQVGWSSASLGSAILRAETAAIAAVAIVNSRIAS